MRAGPSRTEDWLDVLPRQTTAGTPLDSLLSPVCFVLLLGPPWLIFARVHTTKTDYCTDACTKTLSSRPEN